MNPVILLVAVVLVIVFPSIGDACGAIFHVAIIYCVLEFFLMRPKKN